VSGWWGFDRSALGDRRARSESTGRRKAAGAGKDRDAETKSAAIGALRLVNMVLRTPRSDARDEQIHPKNTEQQQQNLRKVHFPGRGQDSAKRTASTRASERDDDGERGHLHFGSRFPTNKINTGKYSILSFLPKFLFVMFSKAAYFYFLVQTCLSWWEVVSPFGGIGFTMALLFVLAVAGIKEIIEDKKRHEFDKITNSTVAHVVGKKDGKIKDERWQDVKVGQILVVYDNEEIPADCICLHTALDNCYIHTANLDGETNLKVKQPMRGVELSREEVSMHEHEALSDLRGLVSSTERAQTMRNKDQMHDHAYRLSQIAGEIHCEPPSADLHTFRGYACISSNPWIDDSLTLEGDDANGKSSSAGEVPKYPLSMGEMLLRGTTLKNSGYVFGIVVYTGKETRIFMNNAETPMKSGSMEYFLNIQISILAVLQLLLCVLCAIGSYYWRDWKGFSMYYLQLDKFVANNYSNTGVYLLIYTLTFWILFSSMVPISLFVTMELVRFWQCIAFIDSDPEMRVSEEDRSMWPKARNSNVNEDLAKISYVFSDKTGTLTSNDMQLRMIGIGTQKCGQETHRFEDIPPDTPAMESAVSFEPSLEETFGRISEWEQIVDHLKIGKACSGTQKSGDDFAHDVLRFFASMSICHNVLPEEEDDDIKYQGASPDEVCIVNAAKQLGFVFRENKANIMYVDILGKTCKFRVMNVLEFSSDRKRMSVIVQDQRKNIYLICKGADVVMLPRLSANKETVGAVDKILHDYSVKGLRCLVFASKLLSFEDWRQWNEEYRAAANDIENREQRMEECMEKIETDLNYLGVTAVEDKLQEEVPESIQILRDAGIKVWVITGDKQETAINIGIACRLITDTDRLMLLNEECKENLKRKINSLFEEVKKSAQSDPREAIVYPQELVVDGKTLAVILPDKSLSRTFASLGALCNCVLVCRASPSQKAAIVDLMKDFEKGKMLDNKMWGFKWMGWLENLTENKMLSIGDGANDVPMIQRADVGVGIAGKEGRQASNNSDFSIARFRFLVRLLLVHGQTTHYRNANLIKYSFYKNIAISVMFLYFQFHSGFSGQASIDSLTLNFYNTVFTAIPILIFSLTDRQVEELKTLLEHPQTYNTSRSLTVLTFWKAQVKAFFDAAICYFIPYYAAFSSGNKNLDNLMAVGRISYLAIQGVVTLEVLAISRHYSVLFVAFVVYSFFIIFPFYFL